MTNRIVWIASYPKSGNTWVRFLAANLLYGRQESAASLGERIPDVHELPAATLSEPIPDIPELSGASVDATTASAAGPPAAVMKTHFAFSPALPYVECTAAAIYVVRDPADVLASNFFYSRRSAGGSDVSPEAFGAYAEAFIEHRGDPRWRELGMGSWPENVAGWLNASHPFPVLRIRYEDMIADALTAGRSIARVLKPGSVDAEIAEAVGNSSFQRMRDIERADIRHQRIGIFYKPYLQASIDSGSRFMRRGLSGDGAARLSADQRRRLYAALAPLSSELGYS